MDALLLARSQFGIITLYHFIFVPLTLGLAPLVAILQTFAYRTGDEAYGRLARFFGTLFVINFTLGVVTGIVQEFQFGMNWSEYSRFVGDIFGIPLAIEALLAFFLESTFLGLWLFGARQAAERAAPGLHLAGGDRVEPLGDLDSDRQRVDAGPGRLRAAQRPRRARRLRRGGAERARVRAGAAHHPRRLGDRRALRARHQRVASAARQRGRPVPPLGAHRRRLFVRRGAADGDAPATTRRRTR